MNADQLSIIEAALQGAKAGKDGRSASENPYQAGVPEHDTWEDARVNTLGIVLCGLAGQAMGVC